MEKEEGEGEEAEKGRKRAGGEEIIHANKN